MHFVNFAFYSIKSVKCLLILNLVVNHTLSKTNLRVSSVQCGLPSPAESSFTPESCRSLVLRSSSLRQVLELKTEARASQHSSDRWQPFSLHTNKQKHCIASLPSGCLGLIQPFVSLVTLLHWNGRIYQLESEINITMKWRVRENAYGVGLFLILIL